MDKKHLKKKLETKFLKKSSKQIREPKTGKKEINFVLKKKWKKNPISLRIEININLVLNCSYKFKHQDNTKQKSISLRVPDG